MLCFKRISLATVACGWLAASAARSAPVIIVHDTFTAVNETSLSSHAPDTNLTGGTYVNGNSPFKIGGTANAGTVSPVSNVAVVGNDGSWAISLASAGPYTKPSYFTIFADLDLNGMVSDPGSPDAPTEAGIIRGITLGFFTDASTGTNLFNQRRAIAGVTYHDSGKLLLVVPDIANNQSTVIDAVSTDSLANPILTTGTHRLSYDVNTMTGDVSNVLWDGVLVNLNVPTTVFTDAATAYAGHYAASGLGNTWGTLDNFTVQTPEPSSLCLMLVGFAAFYAQARKRTRHC